MSKNSDDFEEAKKWFKNHSYKPLAEYSQIEWANQIAKRVFIEDALKNLNKPSENSQLNIINKAFLEIAMPELIVNPLSPYKAGYKNKSQDLSSHPNSTNTVFPLTLLEISNLYLLSKEYKAEPTKQLDEWTFQNPTLGISGFGHLKIDLNARNEDILTEFENWLINYRASIKFPALKPHPKKTELRFVDWCDDKILQYFDIKTWGQWSGKTLKREQILKLLFNGYDLNKIKSVSQKATEIITMKNCIALYNES